MTITDDERETLIKYRIEEAHEAIEDAELSINNNKLKMAVNRIYYGMFYILSALALKHKFKTSKHQGLIAWFSKTFIKDKKIDKNMGILFAKHSDVDLMETMAFLLRLKKRMWRKCLRI